MTLPDRARKIAGVTYREPLSCANGTLYLTVTKDGEGKIREVFISLGKMGGCISAWADSLGRMISIHLRSNGSAVEDIIDTLKDMKCPEGKNSCSHLIAKILKEEKNGDIS